jgi:hypothetical protein
MEMKRSERTAELRDQVANGIQLIKIRGRAEDMIPPSRRVRKMKKVVFHRWRLPVKIQYLFDMGLKAIQPASIPDHEVCHRHE